MTTKPLLDPWLVHQGRYVNVDFMIQSGQREYLIRVGEGAIERIHTDALVMPCWTFRLKATSDAWSQFYADAPIPGYHDLMAMIKFRMLRVEGDQHIFMSNLLYFKELMQALKGVVQ